MWQLKDPVFGSAGPYKKRLALLEEGGRLPLNMEAGPYARGLFSATGSIDDPTPPRAYGNSMLEFVPASEFGFVNREDTTFVLGGGNVDFCLFRTFESLVRIKTRQSSFLQALMPLPLVYASDEAKDPFRYMLGSNRYVKHLRDEYSSGKIPGFAVTMDGVFSHGEIVGRPSIQLHVFGSINSLFSSVFFPEVSTQMDMHRIARHFYT